MKRQVDLRKLDEESYWTWIHRCPNDDVVGQSAARIDRWLRDCPDDWSGELENRLRAKDDTTFFGAYFELLLYRVFLTTLKDWEVSPVPERSNPNSPDLRISNPSTTLWVEATVIRHVEAESAMDLRAFELLRRASDHVIPGWCIWINEFQPTDRLPKAKRIAHHLNTWLATLSWEDARALLPDKDAGLERFPRTTLKDDISGWSFDLLAIPSIEKDDEASGLPFNAGCTSTYWSRLDDRLREAVISKTRQHSDLRDSLIVAVACNHAPSDLDEKDCLNALIGTGVHQYSLSTRESRFSRRTDGVWTRGAVYRSDPPAVLTCAAAAPWHLPPSTLRVWENPYGSVGMPHWPYPTMRWDLETRKPAWSEEFDWSAVEL